MKISVASRKIRRTESEVRMPARHVADPFAIIDRTRLTLMLARAGRVRVACRADLFFCFSFALKTASAKIP